MTKVGVIGIGDMGSGLAKNLIAAGFDVHGRDLLPERMEAFAQMGGHPHGRPSQVGEDAVAVFVMVMNGDQAKAVIADLTPVMPQGAAIMRTCR